MKLIDITKHFATEEKCLDYIEKMRWPDGEIGCARCGEIGRVSRVTRRTEGKNKRNRVYQCGACKKQFSATSGTIFSDSHLPLTKWFMAIAMICEAKKGMSACQLQRHLGVNYRTAWYLCHRIREAMQDGGLLTGVVEADHTYFSARKPRKGKPYVKKEEADVVLGLRERGGRLRLIHVKDATGDVTSRTLGKHVSPDAILQTDAHATFEIIGSKGKFAGHRMINHTRSYADGDNHTQHIESAFSLLKRGVVGSFHKISIKHLQRYCNEFSYRFNRRDMQLEMFDETLRHLSKGQTLPYKKLIEPKDAAA
jgi:transposase-like protein